MSFNLYGEAADDLILAREVCARLLKRPVSHVEDVRFEWSPGRLDERWLGNRTAFDVVFFLLNKNERKEFVAIETKYHEYPQPEKRPSSSKLNRYQEVSSASKVFSSDYEKAVIGTDLQQVWLDHLLALSMLPPLSDKWQKGCFLLLAPTQNRAWADIANRYLSVLTDSSTFRYVSLEDASGVVEQLLPDSWPTQFRQRYLDVDPTDE
ncbi:MAG: hypothetical protein M3O70_17115 [Actinomycetota bacterium]|nr:hypothetical protein [Actinomycetota bacterium]